MSELSIQWQKCALLPVRILVAISSNISCVSTSMKWKVISETEIDTGN